MSNKLKTAIRARQAATGESYVAARAAVLAEKGLPHNHPTSKKRRDREGAPVSATTDFLTTLPFLSDPVREQLRALGLDAPEAVVVYSASEIANMLSGHAAAAGIAGRLLHAARAALSTPGRPSLTPTLERAQRAPSREVAAELRAAGVAFVVLGADDKLEPAGTDALTEHLAAGAPMPPTWQGRRIVPTDEICNPPVFCNPRTGTPLQAGQDELSEVRWGELGRDGLRVAAFGYSEGMFDGMSEAAVFVALTQDTKTRRRRALNPTERERFLELEDREAQRNLDQSEEGR